MPPPNAQGAKPVHGFRSHRFSARSTAHPHVYQMFAGIRKMMTEMANKLDIVCHGEATCDSGHSAIPQASKILANTTTL